MAESSAGFSQDYWCAEEADKLATNLFQRLDVNQTDSVIMRGINSRSSRAYTYYFGLDPSGIHATSQVLRTGDQGQLATIRVNHSRALVNTLLNLITAPKVVWSPKAVNTDYNSLKECELAASLLEYYWVEKQSAQFAIRALEEAIVFTEGYIFLDWDGSSGDDLAPNAAGTGILKTGDVRIRNISTWDVIRDTNAASWDQLNWVVVRMWENRFDLMARYPDKAEEIRVSAIDRVTKFRHTIDTDRFIDLVPVYRFFHKRTAAMPAGRAMTFLTDRCWLSDGTLEAMKLGDIPLYRVSAGETFSTPFGYSPFNEILGIQEVMDSLHTSVASNQTTFAAQCISAVQGSEFSPEEVAGGLKVVYYPPGSQPPAPLQLTSTAPEVFNYIDKLEHAQELIFGLNSVVRGTPQSGEQSGSALALLSSQALQQANVISANYVRFIESVGAGVLDLIRANLSTERQIAVAGKGSSYLITSKPYSGASFNNVRRVHVEVGNPLSQNTSGRLTIAKDLVASGLIKSPEQYMQVLNSGRLEPLTKGLTDELLLIKGENEELSLGKNPPVLYVDDHMLHVREHKCILANMEARGNAQIIQAVMEHIKEHENIYYTTEPALLALLGQRPPMAPPPPDIQPPGAPPPPTPGSPPGTPPPPGGHSVLGAGPSPAPAVEKPPGNPNVGTQPPPPRLPTNPQTKEQYTPATGGLPPK